MSTIPVPQPRSQPPNTTREQLDELDALLQRMLELPVEASGGDGGRPEDALPAPAAHVPLPARVDATAPRPAALVAPPPTPPAPVAAPRLPAAARTLEAPPPNPPPPAAPASSPPVTQAQPPPVHRPAHFIPPGLRPLVLVNHLFDRAARQLGAPGHWLRSPPGRAVLGWAGLGLLAGALGLALFTWSGWF